jgi:hypothetical protein
MMKLQSQQILPHDMSCVKWVVEHIIPPSTKRYNLIHPEHADHSQFKQMETLIPKYLQKRKYGRFLEV